MGKLLVSRLLVPLSIIDRVKVRVVNPKKVTLRQMAQRVEPRSAERLVFLLGELPLISSEAACERLFHSALLAQSFGQMTIVQH